MNDETGDLINLISVLVGLQNLEENREQSRYNDVQYANNKQAEYLLQEINKRFEEQNKVLERQNEMLQEILEKLEIK